jgi:hypothetical protein
MHDTTARLEMKGTVYIMHSVSPHHPPLHTSRVALAGRSCLQFGIINISTRYVPCSYDAAPVADSRQQMATDETCCLTIGNRAIAPLKLWLGAVTHAKRFGRISELRLTRSRECELAGGHLLLLGLKEGLVNAHATDRQQSKSHHHPAPLGKCWHEGVESVLCANCRQTW